MPNTGQAFDKDLVKFFGTVFVKKLGPVDLSKVSNFNSSVGGGTAQFYLPTDIVLTEQEIENITTCAANVTCYDSELAQFELDKAVNEAKIVPNCESNNISSEVKTIALQKYMEAWNRLLITDLRSALETNAVEYAEVSGDDIRADIQKMIAKLQVDTNIDSSNFVVKLSSTAYNQALTPSSTSSILGFTESQLQDHLNVGAIWKDIQATADIVIYVREYALLGTSCVTTPTLKIANGSPEYDGEYFIKGKMKWGVNLVTPAGDYSEFMKVTTYGGVTTPETRTAKATK